MRSGSIQWKLVLIYLLLLLLALQLTGLYVLRSLEQYYLENFSQSLFDQAQVHAGFLERYMTEDTDPDAVTELAIQLQRRTGVEITVVDAEARVLGSSRTALYQPGMLLASEEITQALLGGLGEMQVRDPDSGQRRLLVSLPLRSGGSIVGAVQLGASLEDIFGTLADIRRILLTAGGVSLAVTATVAFALARTITGPIREITSRAAQIAMGDFDQHIEVRSADEIGQLASMFNYLSRRLKDTLQEISDEKSRMEAIITYMADGLVALDHRSHVILVNPAAAAMLGLTDMSLVGRHPDEVLPELGLGEVLPEVLREGAPVSRVLHLPGPSGRVLRGDFAPLRSKTHRASGIVVVLHDVTEQDRLNRMQREFVANVSHELKTPLTTIKSYIETLLDGVHAEPELANRFLGIVHAETNRMVRLVRDLLRLSELDSRAARWELGPLDVVHSVDGTLARLQVQADDKGIKMSRHADRDVPAAWADADKLDQVLLNVLTNAIEYTPAGGEVHVRIGSEGPPPAAGQPGGFVVIAVQDSGPGIPAEDVPRLFERFYRVDKARTRRSGGTGLGLAIAREIVEALGGQIRVDSTLGKGTTVTIALPVAGGEA